MNARQVLLACALALASGCASRPPSTAAKRGPGQPADAPQIEALGIACDAGDAISCGRLGNAYLRAESVAHDLARAEKLHQKACGLGLAASCTNWGALVATRSPAQAFAIYEKSCAAGDNTGCYDEGRALLTGEGVAKDLVRAARLLLGACERGHPSGCSLTGRAYMLGEGFPKDEAKAATYLTRACEGDQSKLSQANGAPLPAMAESCSAAAKLLEPLAKTDAEKRRVATMLEKACDWGYNRACNDAGTAYVELGGEADKSHGMPMIARGCDMGDPTACANMGTFRLESDPFGAAPFLEKACAGKNAQSCSNLGFLYSKGSGVMLDMPKAVRLFERACELDNMLGCLFVGGAYYEGRGVKEDRTRARGFLEKACDGKVGKACAALARMYEYALGVDEDMTRARSYHRRACDAGEAEQCDRAAPAPRPKAK